MKDAKYNNKVIIVIQIASSGLNRKISKIIKIKIRNHFRPIDFNTSNNF
jgi:hypothetical protein